MEILWVLRNQHGGPLYSRFQLYRGVVMEVRHGRVIRQLPVTERNTEPYRLSGAGLGTQNVIFLTTFLPQSSHTDAVLRTESQAKMSTPNVSADIVWEIVRTFLPNLPALPMGRPD